MSGENEESPPFQVHDGDQIEFGVDFVGEDDVDRFPHDPCLYVGLSSDSVNGEAAFSVNGQTPASQSDAWKHT